MESSEARELSESDRLRQEVEQRIGRNVLLFQRMEGLLKCLLAYGSVSGYLSECMANHEHRIASIDRQTMGQLVTQFTGCALTDSETGNRAPEVLNEIWFSVDFKLPPNDSSESSHNGLTESLAAVVSERNALIHHFLPRFDLSSLQDAHAAVDYLDGQRERFLPLLAMLKSIVIALRDHLKTCTEFMKSEAGTTCLYLWFFEGRQVIQFLTDFASEKARPDGWAVLATAARLLEQEFPGQLAALKARFDQRTLNLKGFLLFTGWFEVFEEATAKGGVRVLYRAKCEQVWQVVP